MRNKNASPAIASAIVAFAVVVALLSHRLDSSPAEPNLSTDSAALVQSEPTLSPLTATAVLSTPDPSETSLATTDLQSKIDQLLASESGVYGVVVTNTSGDIEYSRNATTPFVAASLYKLVLLADIYQRINNGEIQPTDELLLRREYFPAAGDLSDGYYQSDQAGTSITVEQALFATGAYSSNVSAKALMSLTNAAALESMAQQIGLQDTHFAVTPTSLPNWPPKLGIDSTDDDLNKAVTFVDQQAANEAVNLTTPHDMATYFTQLMAGKIVNGEASYNIFSILTQQAVDDRFPVLLPAGTGMAHKTGNLDHVVHDVGVIFAPGSQFVLAAMVEDSPDDTHTTQVIQKLALIAYNAEAAAPTASTRTPSTSSE